MHGLLVLLPNEMGVHVSHLGGGEGGEGSALTGRGGGCTCREEGPAAFPTTKLLALILLCGSAEPQACGFDEARQLAGGRDPSDVPLLLAPVAFEGAALHRPPVKVGSV